MFDLTCDVIDVIIGDSEFIFCGGKALNGNVKHVVFELTCDVIDVIIGDSEFIKICFIATSFPGLSNGS